MPPRHRPTPARSRTALVVVGLVVALVATLVPLVVPTASASPPRPRPASPATRPLGLNAAGRPMSMPDPAVTRLPGGGYVAFATGERIGRFVAPRPRGPWRAAGQAFRTKDVPRWMRRGTGPHVGTIWAPEILHDTAGGRDRWLLYYSAIPGAPRLRGGNPRYRCISVAVADDPRGTFRTPKHLQNRPLRCLRGSGGIIDPSVLLDRGAAYLLYKTRSLPARLRLARLNATRLGVVAGSDRDLVRDDHDIIENPVVARLGAHYVLLASHGSYRTCAYRTDYWVSGTLHFDGPARTLLASDRGPATGGRRTTVCGPGGGDVVRTAHGTVLFFHGTLVRRPDGRWRPGTRDGRDVRTLHGATLTWDARGRRPTVHAWLTPPAHRSHHRARPETAALGSRHG